GWCPLSPAGAQTTQLLVEPPWTPAVLWDQVTLTCKSSGIFGKTIWYKDKQPWLEEKLNSFLVTRSGTYACHRWDTGLSPTVDVVTVTPVLQVPVQALLEGDTVTLRCRV
ncbi:FCRL5 protein, partial [Ptilonorhynchus violaceus]|nr:FCRL5 protein [Ptilonorhynchus violaceus]